MKKRYNILLLLGSLLLAACHDRSDFCGIGPEEDTSSGIYFTISAVDMPQVEVTRAAENNIETDIYSIHLLVFNKSGVCLLKRYYAHEQGAATPMDERDFPVTLPVLNEDDYTSCTVYFVSNIGVEPNTTGGEDYFADVADFKSFQAKFGMLALGGVKRSKCIPMFGYIENVDLTRPTPAGAVNPNVVVLERITARINFQIKVYNNHKFYFSKWNVYNVPRYSYILPAGKDYAADNVPGDGSPSLYFRAEDLVAEEKDQSLQSFDNNVAESGVYTFYMLENRKGKRGPKRTDNPEHLSAPDDRTGKDQRFKALYAPDYATYVVIEGLGVDDDQNIFNLKYSFYLGSNNYDDYNIMRNHDYTYVIHMHGIKKDDISVEAYDSRVHKSYSFVASVLRSEFLDAHYEKRPLIVSALGGESEVGIFRDEACTESVTDKTGSWLRLSLEDTYSFGSLPEAESVHIKGVSHNSSGGTAMVVRRYYIYADENISPVSRTLYAKVTHTATSGITNSQVYEFTQAGLKMVDNAGFGVESFEEYTLRLDPEDEVDVMTNGLPWGFMGVKMQAADDNDGLKNTGLIVAEEKPYGTSTDYYNTYAARYCYDKNKREADGTVLPENMKWFLPSRNQQKEIKNIVSPDKNYWTSTQRSLIDFLNYDDNSRAYTVMNGQETLPETWWFLQIPARRTNVYAVRCIRVKP